MSRLFLDIFNLSITASWLILAVMLTRFAFRKRAPKWVNCLLWGLVGFRLLFPFTIESRLSLVPTREPLNVNAFYSDLSNSAYFQSGISVIDDTLNTVVDSSFDYQSVLAIVSVIWLVGMALMLLHAVINFLLLKHRVSTAIPFGNTRKSEAVESPFVLGFFRPRIYLPFGLSPETEECVIAHEKAHIKRRDHLIKPIGYAVLSVYWFNPLVWLAYILLCRDIECACDEKVVKNMDIDGRKAYATALLECSLRKNYVAACPLAFGEIGVKDRVKNTVRYKKPAFWVLLCAAFACVTVSALFLTSPKTSNNDNGFVAFLKDLPAQIITSQNSGNGINAFFVKDSEDENANSNQQYPDEYEHLRRMNELYEATESSWSWGENSSDSWWSTPDPNKTKDSYFDGGW